MMRILIHLWVSCVVILLLSGCSGAPGYPKQSAEVLRPEDQLSFVTLYSQNCAACHGADGQNGAAIDLANPEYQALVDDSTLRNWISGGVPGTQMPAFAISMGGTLTDRQIDVIMLGMRRSWSQRAVLDGQNPPPYAQDQKGDALRGKQAYNSNCVSCHQPSTQQVASPDYLALVSDQTLRSIIIAGRPDIGHPDWRGDKPGYSLSPQDVSDIVTYLGTLRSATPGQPYPQGQ